MTVGSGMLRRTRPGASAIPLQRQGGSDNNLLPRCKRHGTKHRRLRSWGATPQPVIKFGGDPSQKPQPCTEVGGSVRAASPDPCLTRRHSLHGPSLSAVRAASFAAGGASEDRNRLSFVIQSRRTAVEQNRFPLSPASRQA